MSNMRTKWTHINTVMIKNLIVALSICGLSIDVFSSEPNAQLVRNADGYGNKRLDEVADILWIDGISKQEAHEMAKWLVYGRVDHRRDPIQSFDEPKNFRDYWQIDVHFAEADGKETNPIFIDQISGQIHGPGWSNMGGGIIDLGTSTYSLKRGRLNKYQAIVRLNRYSESGDEKARQDCYNDAVKAIDLIKENFPGKFWAVTEASIQLGEGLSSHRGKANRKWSALIELE